jgi:hypothetical protein
MAKRLFGCGKKIVVLCGMVLLSVTLKAQVSVQFTNTGYLLTKDQLWNMVLVNTGGALNVARIEITLSDVGSNQLLCRFTSKNMSLAAGPKNITVQDALPVQTTVYSPGFTDVNPYGILPPGRYYMCIDVLRFGEDAYTSVGDACEDIEAVAFSPVQLVLPENNSVIESRLPLFTWLSPMPVTQYGQLQYDLKLVELLQNQQAVDGIDNNLPVATVPSVAAASFQYLPAMPALQPGHVYAWQVTAKNGTQPISVSEVFTFIMADSNNVRPGAKNAVYSPLKKDAGSNFITITGELNVEYINELNDREVTAKLIDLNAAPAAAVVKENLVLPVVYGLNFISLAVKEDYNIVNGRFYKLIVQNSKKEEWTITFISK